MRIIKAEFTASAVNPEQYPQKSEGEIALVGRSNVGKSSLINKFVNRKGMAHTSSQPGKTQTLNFYHINDSWYFVDLPGYGYARVSKAAKSTWAKFINEYLLKRAQLAGIMQIVDLRHPPSRDDVDMYEWLTQSGIPFLLVATKADKISRGQWPLHKRIILSHLGAPPEQELLVFSAQTGVGLEELASWVEKCLDKQ